MFSHHTVCDVAGAEAEQIPQLWGQAAATYSAEVVERKQVKVFGQMSGKCVKLIQNTVNREETSNAVFMVFQTLKQCSENTYSLAKRQVFKRFFMWFNCSLNACNRTSTNTNHKQKVPTKH